MTPENTKKNEPVFRTPDPSELKAASVEDSILDRQPPEADVDSHKKPPEAEQADAVDASVDDRSDDGSTSDQIVKANISGH